LKLSVLIITYNQEHYISQAIESALAQDTNFPYEIVIGEDYSTDRTREIVCDYASKHSETIRLLPSTVNFGMNLNFDRTLKSCNGQYVAILEGDDYWTCNNKLQKQVDYLDTHLDCALCFHNVKIMHNDGRNTTDYFPPIIKPFYYLDDLLHGNFIQTCSTVFRNRLFDELPNWILSLKVMDWPLHILNAEHGKIGYLNETMAVYRVHSDGVWSGTPDINKLESTIEGVKGFSTYFSGKRSRLLKSLMAKHYCDLATRYSALNNTPAMKKSIYRAISIDIYSFLWLLSNHSGTMLRLFMPSIYRIIKMFIGRFYTANG
jgi:glycosyltransferase involved in cell wall biosynthesis